MFTPVGLYVAIALAAYAYASPLATDPVCIVGAGPSGLTIAHGLEAKGYSVVVFDKQAEVGGKCQCVYDGPDQSYYHSLGALIFTKDTWVNTLPLIEASGLPVTTGAVRSNSKFYGAGAAASVVTPSPPITDAQEGLMMAELDRYTDYWNSHFAPRYTAPRYANGVPKEWTVPMADWLKSQGYLALYSVFEIGMTPYGYGDITQTPTIYMLQYFTPDILSSFIGVVPTYEVDFHKVMVHYAASIKGPVLVNAAVTAVDRSGPAPVVTYNNGSSPATQRCTKLVLAFPPTLANLQAIAMPLTPLEQSVFSEVQITAYWSGAVSTQVNATTAYLQNPFEPLGAPVGFVRTFAESPITTTWSWGVMGTDPPLSDITGLLVKTLSEMQVGLGVPEPGVTLDDVKAIRKLDYFPHFGSEALAEEVYAGYNAMQGEKDTYYSSGLSSFEIVEFAIRAGKDLVETYF